MDVRALVEQQEQWTANRRFVFLFPSSRASRSCRAPRGISRSPRLAHKAPVMQAKILCCTYRMLNLRERQYFGSFIILFILIVFLWLIF